MTDSRPGAHPAPSTEDQLRRHDESAYDEAGDHHLPVREVRPDVRDEVETRGEAVPDVRRHPPLWRPGLLIPGAAMLALAFGMGPWVERLDPHSVGDWQFLRFLADNRSGALTKFALGLDFVGGPKVTPWLTVAIMLLLIAFKRRVLGILVGLITFISWLPGHYAKAWFTRERPPKALDPAFQYSGADASSFPSGHTSFAMALVVALTFAVGATGHHRRWPLIIGTTLVVLVGLARLYLGVHWPTDVVAGILFGLGTAMLLWPLASWLYARARARWPHTA